MRMRASSPKLRPTWWDGLAAAIVAALAIFTAAWYYGGLARSGPLTAAIVHRGQVVQTVELDRLTEEMTVTVEGTYHLTVTLDKTGVRVSESDCPGRTASTPEPSPGRDRALSACRSRWWCSCPAAAAAPTRCWDRRDAMKITTRQLALCAVLTALALGLSTLENLFPVTLVIPLPGVKLGLANIVTVFALYQLGPLPALCILAARCLLGSLFAGNASALLFSLLGGTLAMLVMLALSRLPGLSVYGVSIGGAAGHNIGQMAAALITLGNTAVLGYLPFLLAVSLFTGALTGFVSALLLRAISHVKL